MAALITRKRLLKTRSVQLAVAFLLSLVVRLIYATARVEKIFSDTAPKFMLGDSPAIYCFWHGRMIMHPFMKPRGRPMHVLISHHNDGAIITAVMRWFGIDSVRGSRNRGSNRAVAELMKITRTGGNICITPDGPRGPFQKAALGAAYIAAKTGYPLVPVTFSASRHWRFKSWDRFMLPKFFSRITFVVGEPIGVPDDSDDTLQKITSRLENAITEATNQADRLSEDIA